MKKRLGFASVQIGKTKLKMFIHTSETEAQIYQDAFAREP